MGILFFYLDFLNGVQHLIALHAQNYLITNSFGGRQGKAEAMLIFLVLIISKLY
jgi:hypothetical protein